VFAALTGRPSCTQVEDFFEFKQHLQLSLQQSLITVEALRMSLLKGTLDAASAELSACRLDQMVANAPGKGFLRSHSILGFPLTGKGVSTTAGSFADHRDFKTLPDYQSRASSPIWEQSHLGQQLNVCHCAFFQGPILLSHADLCPFGDLRMTGCAPWR
jgi:hypothetical protein